MFKKIFVFFLVLSFAIAPFYNLSTLQAADNEVCGIDGETYASSEAATEAGVDVSYEFACTETESEEDLYENMEEINFAGMLIEVGSTDIPTTLIVRDNTNDKDYTIEVSEETVLGQNSNQAVELSNWIPGDQIRVVGEKNNNTGTIEASILTNLSFNVKNNSGINGWISEIDQENKTITYQWSNVEHTFSYNDETKFVVGGINPASANDLKINDRIRGRLVENEAKIVVVLRRGEDLFMKIRTFRPNATITRLDNTIVPTTIQVRIETTPELKKGDVNNLIGEEGTLLTINITEDTNMVRKYFGKTTLAEFAVDDSVKIVGRVNDDGTVDAKLLKNESIWKVNSMGHAGIVTEINTEENYLMMDWTPYKLPSKAKLKEKIQNGKEKVQAQIASVEPVMENDLKKESRLEKLKTKAKNVKEKMVGNIKRVVENIKVQINRIAGSGLKIGDVIERGEVKSVKVLISEKTKIIVGNNNEAKLSDIAVEDKIRVRGTANKQDESIVADTIVVVSEVPEIEEDLDTEIDEINEYVSNISTDDGEEDTATEEVIEDDEIEENNNEEDVEILDVDDEDENEDENQTE